MKGEIIVKSLINATKVLYLMEGFGASIVKSLINGVSKNQ